MQDYIELEEIITPPTREDRNINRIFLNWHSDVTDSECLPPLETEGSDDTRTYSDHKIQFACTRIEKKEPVKCEKFSYRPYNDRAAETFLQELSQVSWGPVYQCQNTNDMAAAYQNVIDDLMDKNFPIKTITRKEDNLPWLNSRAKKIIRKKKAIYKAEGKSVRWEEQLAKTEKYLEERRQVFLKNQRDKFSGLDAARNFFKNVKAFKSADKPKEFDIRDLRPDNSDSETAAEVAAYFNRISCEFEPLEPHQIPSTYHRDLPMLSPADVVKLIKEAKKPNSILKGDIFPKMINRCAEHIAWPLSAIFNTILSTYVWPVEWKREYVTIIPKKSMPELFADLRNILCTLFISKIFKKYVQRCIKEEVELKSNQYGGLTGCSTTHMIIDILQEICENAEDYRSATVLCAIDYSKAFNLLPTLSGCV